MKTTFSENLKTLREERKLSQRVLAENLNISWHTVSHWETGYTEPSIEQIKNIAKYFDVTIDELLCEKL